MSTTADRHRRWGTNLSTARLVRGFTTQQAFADAIGVSQQAVSHWERGTAAPADDLKVKIAAVLGLEPHVLFPLVEVAS